jgi:hypothetical protein
VEPATAAAVAGTVHVADPPDREQNASILAKLVQIPRELAGQRRLDLHARAGERVRERKPGRVEKLAAEGGIRHAVDRIADYRQPDSGEVDADLVRPAGLEVDAEERVLADQLEELEVCDCVAGAVGVEGLSGRVAAVAADGGLDAALPRPRTSADEGDIGPLEAVFPDELLQPLVSLVGSGNYEEPGCVAVEPMDDSRAVLVPACGSVGQHPVDERPGGMPRGRMHDDAGRFVNDEEVLVLVRNPEPDLLRCQRRRSLRRIELDLLTPAKASALRGQFAVDEDASLLQQPLGGSARPDLRKVGEEAIEPEPGRCVRNGDSSQVRVGAAPARRAAAPRSGCRHPRR